jgi:uncharacterized damage-inducible protein DinB
MLGVGLAAPVAAQEMAESPALTMMRGDWDGVTEKLVSLAEAIPEESYGWAPAEGVRSVAEVLVHVAGPNMALGQQLLGGEAEGENPVAALGPEPTKEEILAALEASIELVDKAFAGLSEEKLGSTYQAFGREMSGYRIANILTTHSHEHLGQLIAYARSNGVVPPWSK